MEAIHELSWMCSGCGYVVNAATALHRDQRDNRPTDGSIALCANCGNLHVRHGPRWLPITAAERAALDPEWLTRLMRIGAAIRRKIPVDLAASQTTGRT